MSNIKELKNEELKKVTGGTGETEQKYPNGYICYETVGADFYNYYLILSYDYTNQLYVCEKYSVDCLNHYASKNLTNSTLPESRLNDMTKAYSIPYWEG